MTFCRFSRHRQKVKATRKTRAEAKTGTALLGIQCPISIDAPVHWGFALVRNYVSVCGLVAECVSGGSARAVKRSLRACILMSGG